jgi:archaemetzincin
MKRRILWAIIGLLAGGLAAWWILFPPPPTAGKGQPDSPRAAQMKQRVYAQIAPLDEAGFTRLTPENLNGWQIAFEEPLQDFEGYRAAAPLRLDATRRVVVLQPIGPFDARQEKLLQNVAVFCEAYFQLPVRVEKPLGLELCSQKRPGKLKEGGEQYNATSFIEALVARLPADAALYLGVTMADLWAGDLNFVFGQGSMTNRTGVYSLRRFRAREGQAGVEALELRRSCQLMAHESGHLLGVWHCLFYKCVMNGVNSLGEADAAPLDLCPVCHRKVLWNLGCNAEKRYGDLLAFYRKHGLAAESEWTQTRLENWRRLQQK